MLKTIQMQKAKPTQKQNKKPTHNAGKITKKKLKKRRFIGGAKKNIYDLSIKEKLEFLKHCLNNTIQGDLRQILYTANANALKYFPTYGVGYIDMFKIVIKYVLLCLINNSTNNEWKDTVRSNNCYLLLKNKCPGTRCQYSIDFESEKDLDSKEEEELNKIADQYYNTFKNYVSEIVEKPHDNIIINKYIKAIYPDGIAILTKNSDNYVLNINNSETPIEEYSKIIEFLKNNTNKKFLIILKKEDSNTDDDVYTSSVLKEDSNTDDVYNCMMQIIMKLVDIFSSENNSKYYELIINGTDENKVYLSMNEEASRERLKVAEEERLKLIADHNNKKTKQTQGIQKPEKKITAEQKLLNDFKGLFNIIINNIQSEGFKINSDIDKERHTILLKSLKNICWTKFKNINYDKTKYDNYIYDEYSKAVNHYDIKKASIKHKPINFHYIDACDSVEMALAYQHIINILVDKNTNEMTDEHKQKLIDLSIGQYHNNCTTTIDKIIKEKSYLLSEPTIFKDFIIKNYFEKNFFQKPIHKVLSSNEHQEAEQILTDFKNNIAKIIRSITNNNGKIGKTDMKAIKATNTTKTKVHTIYRDIYNKIITEYDGFSMSKVLPGNIEDYIQPQK